MAPVRGRYVIELIRATRNNPPGLAAGDRGRARRYTAGLEQFEELLEAAGTIGAAASPIPLFYALEQAGYSIAAARLGANDGVLPHRHGLQFEIPGGDWEAAVVKPTKRDGTFQAVCTALASPQLPADVLLPAILASLPEATGQPVRRDRHPHALSVVPIDSPGPMAALRMTDKAGAWVGAVPDAFAEAGDRVAFLRSFLAQYPSADGWEPPDSGGVPAQQGPDGSWYARLQWVMPTATGSGSDRIAYLFREVAPRCHKYGRGWLRPALVPGTPPPTPVMTWWALLYGLSMLARYHPDEWMDMLAIDSSKVAAAIETILDDALTAVPKLVLSAVTGREFLEE